MFFIGLNNSVYVPLRNGARVEFLMPELVAQKDCHLIFNSLSIFTHPMLCFGGIRYSLQEHNRRNIDIQLLRLLAADFRTSLLKVTILLGNSTKVAVRYSLGVSGVAGFLHGVI